MDICVLAGGYGTRLKGLWDKPKCLVPYHGQPVIEYIVNKALKLKPRRVFLLLGHQASAVVKWREDCCPHRYVVPIIETEPSGTASAIRHASPFITLPLMVLNGDTIPGYDLKILCNENIHQTVVAWCDGRYAGASILSFGGMNDVMCSHGTDLDVIINNPKFLRVHVTQFLDVGTPEGFHKTQMSLTWPKDYDCMEHT